MARSYASPLRSAQAAQTRRRILDAAATLFADEGYSTTSLAQIAASAGVSLETVKLNGPKSALLLGAFDQAFSGLEEGPPIHQREIGTQLALAPKAELLEGLVDFVAGANARIARLWPVFVGAASGDKVVAKELDALQRRRWSDFRSAVELFRERGLLTGDTNAAERAAALSFLLSPEGYTQLVIERKWSETRYRAWLIGAIQKTVLTG